MAAFLGVQRCSSAPASAGKSLRPPLRFLWEHSLSHTREQKRASVYRHTRKTQSGDESLQ